MSMDEKIYHASGGDIHYWVSCCNNSSRRWIVFLPGLSADHHLFDQQMQYFTKEYNCLVWDAPAHGTSRPFILDFSLTDMSDYLQGIFDQEHIKEPIMIGQSLGGYISQVYMERYPHSVVGFVSIDSCSLKRKYYTWWEIAWLKHTKMMYLSIPWKLLVKWGAFGTARSTYGRMLMTQTMLTYQKKEYCNLAAHGFKIFAMAVEANHDYDIKCPALLICGKKDMAGSAKRYNKNWAECDGMKLIWVDNAGHNSNTDQPEFVNKIIDEFIRTIDD